MAKITVGNRTHESVFWETKSVQIKSGKVPVLHVVTSGPSLKSEGTNIVCEVEVHFSSILQAFDSLEPIDKHNLFLAFAQKLEFLPK